MENKETLIAYIEQKSGMNIPEWLREAIMECPTDPNQSETPTRCDLISRTATIDAVENLVASMSVCINVDEYNGMRDMKYRALKAINELPSAQPDLDSAYTEGYTQAEEKYRALWDEMQATIKAKAFGKRKGLIHTADINAMPTIEERKTGKWINLEVAPFANNDGQLIYEKMCNQCGTIAYFRSVGNGCIGNNFCPNCGERMVQEGEE